MTSLVYRFTDDTLYELTGRSQTHRHSEKIRVGRVHNDLRFKNGKLQQAIEVIVEYESFDTVSNAHHFYVIWVDVPELGDEE